MIYFCNLICLFVAVVEFEPMSGDYYPILFVNDYWNLMREYTPINDTVT